MVERSKELMADEARNLSFDEHNLCPVGCQLQQHTGRGQSLKFERESCERGLDVQKEMSPSVCTGSSWYPLPRARVIVSSTVWKWSHNTCATHRNIAEIMSRKLTIPTTEVIDYKSLSPSATVFKWKKEVMAHEGEQLMASRARRRLCSDQFFQKSKTGCRR